MTFYSLTTWSSARTKKENRSRGIGQRKGVVERGGGGGGISSSEKTKTFLPLSEKEFLRFTELNINLCS